MQKYSQTKNNSRCQNCELRLIGKTLFSNISNSVLQKIQRTDEYISANTTIYEKGDNNTHIYTIKKGIIKLNTIDTNYKTRTISLITSGMSFGLEAINKSSYLQSAISLTSAEFCKIELTKEHINQNTSLLSNILKKWQENLNNQSQTIENFSTGSTSERIIRLFLYIKENYTYEAQNNFYLPRLEDISSIVNVSKENCSRALSKMKKSQKITLVNKKTKIYNL